MTERRKRTKTKQWKNEEKDVNEQEKSVKRYVRVSMKHWTTTIRKKYKKRGMESQQAERREKSVNKYKEQRRNKSYES